MFSLRSPSGRSAAVKLLFVGLCGRCRVFGGSCASLSGGTEKRVFSVGPALLVNPCCCRKSFEAAAAPTQQLWRRRIPRTATRWIKMSNLRHPSCFPRKPRRRRRKRKTRIWYDNDDDVLLHLLLLSRLVLVKSRTEFSGGLFFFGHSKHASFLQLRNRVKT